MYLKSKYNSAKSRVTSLTFDNVGQLHLAVAEAFLLSKLSVEYHNLGLQDWKLQSLKEIFSHPIRKTTSVDIRQEISMRVEHLQNLMMKIWACIRHVSKCNESRCRIDSNTFHQLLYD